jgi:tRNA(His) 5'-end guanylyltransferase
LVIDYFRWRSEDAHRNALNGHCYWKLRSEGRDATSAARELKGMSVAAKNEMLFQRGINFNEVASWQKRGVGVFWESFEKAGTNPVTGQFTTAARRRPRVELELPMRDEYDEFIRQVLADTPSANADLPGRGRL